MKDIFRKWIAGGGTRPFYARREFQLPERPRAARAYVCGLGQFQLYVNGRKISGRVLDPAWSAYDKLIYYVEFDIADALRPGENVIAAEVGNGWYLMDTGGGYSFRFPEFMPPNPNPYQPFGKELILGLRAEMTFADDTRLRIDTDETWKVAPHPIQISNCYGSEVMDGRKAVPGWNSLETDPSLWRAAEPAEPPKGELALQTMPGVEVIHTYEGRYLYTKDGKSVYDFGQNASGMLSFLVKGKAGDTIRLYPAEKLGPDGLVDQRAKNWMDIDVCETYIIGRDDTWEAFEMTFTYCGCRYVQAEGCAPSRLRDLRLRAISSATEKAGSFFCDDPRYMQIYRLIEKAVEANMVSVHTDCPTIERFAWQEENHLMAPSIMYMFQVKEHWEKFLRDARTAQHTAEDAFNDLSGGKYYPGAGLVPSQAPCYIPNVLPVLGLGDFYDIAPWGSAIILGTWWHYQFYGDSSVVRENYEAGKRYLAHLKSKVNGDGFLNHGLGDWGDPAREFARENVETAFLYADARVLETFALLLERSEDAEGFRRCAEDVKRNYNEKLLVYDPARGRYCYRVWEHQDAVVTTQAAEALPLYWGIVPEERRADVAEALREAVVRDGAIVSGEVGHPYIIQTLSALGMNELISELILKEEHPSYYAFVKAGETTLGEYWEDDPRSRCHDMLGHIAEWFYNGIAGIHPLEPGFRKVLIRPYLPASVDRLDCVYRSAAGEIRVSMRRGPDGVALEAEAAPGISCEIDRSDLC